MNIEITNKEKTALSLLLGLRQKFAIAVNAKTTYSALELHALFSELIRKINKEELRFVDTLIESHNSERGFGKSQEWDEVNKQIERSTIKRYNWNKVFGQSLTQQILYLKKSGLSVHETYNRLRADLRVGDFIDDNPVEEKVKILENLKISVHARYGENNTANKVMGGEE